MAESRADRRLHVISAKGKQWASPCSELVGASWRLDCGPDARTGMHATCRRRQVGGISAFRSIVTFSAASLGRYAPQVPGLRGRSRTNPTDSPGGKTPMHGVSHSRRAALDRFHCFWNRPRHGWVAHCMGADSLGDPAVSGHHRLGVRSRNNSDVDCIPRALGTQTGGDGMMRSVTSTTCDEASSKPSTSPTAHRRRRSYVATTNEVRSTCPLITKSETQSKLTYAREKHGG